MEERSPRWRSRPPKGPRKGYGGHNHTDDVYAQQQGEQKFIGGAERARRNAQKRQRMNGGVGFGPNQKRTYVPNSDGRCNRTVARIPKSAKPSERFFASLFRSTVDEFKRSDDSDVSRTKLMSIFAAGLVCQCLPKYRRHRSMQIISTRHGRRW